MINHVVLFLVCIEQKKSRRSKINNQPDRFQKSWLCMNTCLLMGAPHKECSPLRQKGHTGFGRQSQFWKELQIPHARTVTLIAPRFYPDERWLVFSVTVIIRVCANHPRTVSPVCCVNAGSVHTSAVCTRQIVLSFFLWWRQRGQEG